ncbi:MAG: hypothetical protein N2205_06940 [Candidatus Caldatribacterium sp.]|uniref:hypothetical protein n=1 Tax=Candidatus Caldatribacterium sp. TaxID=2282143 RepID=UPI002995BBFE|nr:hypothetical protein [Candidatus Caldatribacterium sp.]MCX7730930.1 hypothetical protein [Candidatus Caldatribacterium sp.]MDW8081438.1 hypothetical protein [Candidatus Calescibacterium sp.]
MSHLVEKSLRIASIIGLSWGIVHGSRFILRRSLTKRLKPFHTRKVETLFSLTRSVTTYLVVFFALLLIL